MVKLAVLLSYFEQKSDLPQAISLLIKICLKFSQKWEPGYNEPRLQQTNLADPELFVITEFDFILISD